MEQSIESKLGKDRKQNLYKVGGLALILVALSSSILHHVIQLANQSMMEVPMVSELESLSAMSYVSGPDVLIFFLVLTLTTFIPVAARFPLILQNADLSRTAKTTGKAMNRSSLGLVPLLLIGGLIYGLQFDVPAQKEESTHHSPCIFNTETAAHFGTKELLSDYQCTPTCQKS